MSFSSNPSITRAAAPNNAASCPNFDTTIFVFSDSLGILCSFKACWIGASHILPADAPLPLNTISSGFSKWTRIATPLPILYPASENSPMANLSPFRAASLTDRNERSIISLPISLPVREESSPFLNRSFVFSTITESEDSVSRQPCFPQVQSLLLLNMGM